jgi:signal transduction histidine kinase
MLARSIPPEDAALLHDTFMRAMQTSSPFILEHRVIRPDGTVRWVYDIAEPHFDEQGTLQSYIGATLDITDRKRSEAALAEAKRAAEAASAAKGAFLANMSHEIRTPLNGVLGLAQIGYRDNVGRGKAQETFAKILDSGKLLLTVINDILDFSKIEAGKLDIEAVPYDPSELADGVMHGVNALAAAKDLRLSVDKTGLPAGCLGDPTRITQVLLNLLSNAIKFTAQGEVNLAVRREGTDLVFAVRDSGIGIPPEVLARLFQPFEQADNGTTRKYGGTGLGLVISRRLAELMGGALAVASTPGVGSTFTLRLPLQESAAPTAAAPTGTAGNRRLAGLRLLVADRKSVV